MKTRSSLRRVIGAIAVVAAAASAPAQADVYTWVDSSGKLNLSNRPPPEGTRITNVFRESPAVRANSEAARAAAEREEVRALSERVKQLEQDLDTAKRATPASAPAPVVYVPVPAPAPYPSVMAQAIVAPSAPPTYGYCNDPWGSCFSPGSFGFYPGGVVVVNAPATPRFHPDHRVPRGPASPARALPAAPTGNPHAPLNLFGDGRPLNLFGPAPSAQGISR